MEKVAEDNRQHVWRTVLEWRRSRSNIDKIYSVSSPSAPIEKTRACSDVYVNCRPESSWEHLASQLYRAGEMAAVDHARSFLPPRGKKTILLVVTAFVEVYNYIDCN